MLKGTIDEFPLIDVLGILQTRNKTGRLEIERQAGRGLIYVRLGEPYYAESSLTRSLIGQKLVDIGAITDMQLRKALDRQAESGERLGQILLTHGVISGEHVAQAVISQIKDALADLLAWEAGEFRWEAGAEVEVEVPLFGATIGPADEGANPQASHVVPVITEVAAAAAEDPAQPVAVTEHADFPQGGTTMTGDEVTAMPIETSPDAGQDPNLEIVHSAPEVDDDAEAEEEDSDETSGETDQEPEQEQVSEQEQASEPEPVQQFEAQPEQAPEPEQVSEPVHEFESEPEPETEPEPVHEFETQPEQEPEPVHEFQARLAPEFPHLTIDSQPVLEPEVPVSFHATRVIKSQPAPELDEEFEAVFEATERVAFDLEPPADPVIEPAAEPVLEAPFLDPRPVADPVFGADAFKPIPHDNDFDQPTFEPATGGADPVFDSANFEPVTETPEPTGDDVAETDFNAPPPDFETPAPEFEAPEPITEVSEPVSDTVQPEPVKVAPEMPAGESMPVAPSPPPPPDAPDAEPAPEAPETDATEAASSETPAEAPPQGSPPSNGLPTKSLKDIKLDRSSLVRELSDLLR
ncbi:hypothetical protein BH20ACT23_BH20ACT23_06730 [soil metagenome]